MRKCIIYILFLLPIIISYPQSKSEKIDDLLSRYHEYNLLNGSVLVADQGKVIFSKGYGYANIEWDIKNSPQTVHRIGSITKQFVATMIMQLVEEGKVAPHEKMTSYIKEYRKDTGDKVTIHHLLTHTSGIPSYTAYPGFWSDSSRNNYSLDDLTTKFCSGDLDFEPGSKYLYNNSGYLLLAKVIEEVTGKSYTDNMRERIFDKVGMKTAYHDRHGKIIKNRATGYDKMGSSFKTSAYFNVANAIGAGDLAMTTEDLYLWDQALYSYKLISEESKKKIFSPFLSNYGYGWNVAKIENPAGGDSLTKYSHGGGINGFNALISRVIDNKQLIVVLNNTGGAPLSEMGKNITQILYNQDYNYPKKPIGNHILAIIEEEGVDEAVKAYKEISEHEKDSFGLKENELNNLGYTLMRSERLEEAIKVFKLNIDAYPKSFNTYDSMGEALMKNGDKEEAIKNYKTSIELNPQNFGGYKMLKKLGVDIEPKKDSEVSKEKLQSYVGDYELFPNFIISVSSEEGNLFAQATGQGKFKVYPETVTKFYYKVVQAKIEFFSSDNGTVNKLVLYQGGKEMPGLRVK